MRIENTVEVDAPLDRVWALVNDIPRVAPCMPGAALTGVLDDTTYEGTVAVKLGPLRMSYKGKVVVEGVDEVNHSARLAATGKDTKGAGTARASVETRMEAVGDNHTRLHVTSDVQLTGKVASFGRGGAINDVATRLFGQFADCLRATLESESAPAGSAEGAGATAAAGGTTAQATSAETSPSVSPQAGTPGTETSPASTSASPSPQAGPPSTAPSPSASPDAGPPSEAGAAGDGTTTTGDGGAAPQATPPTAVTPRSPQVPAPRPVEALDAGSLVGTVLKGRLTALFQAIAGFFRRLFGRRSTG